MKKSLALLLSFVLVLVIPLTTVASDLPDSNSSTKATRLWGETKYDTALAIADRLATKLDIDFTAGDKFQNVVVASGNNYHDALAGAPLAVQLEAPILLLNKTPQLSKSVLQYIDKNINKSGDLYILGGTAVVPDSFISYFTEMGFDTARIHRLGGYDCNETSLLISKQLTTRFDSVALVSDSNFYDALSIAPLIAYEGSPMLLVSKKGLTPEQKEFCDAIPNPVAVGELANDISTIYPKAMGITGKNRYETNAIVNLGGVSSSVIYLATGENYPDALSGAVLAAAEGAPVILTAPDKLQSDTIDILNFYSSMNELSALLSPDTPASKPNLVVFGGKAAVSENVLMEAQQLLNGPGYSIGNSTGNILNEGLAAIQGEWIYYSDNYSENGGLYKVKIDGTGKMKLSNDSPLYINVSGDWVYYSNYSDNDKLYKIKTDGTKRTKLSDDGFIMTTLIGNWIYYINSSDGNTIWKTSIDGRVRTRINDDYSLSINVTEDTIYYVNADDDSKIYKVDTDGYNNTRINDNVSAMDILVIDDTIYFSNLSPAEPLNLYKMKTDGTEAAKIIADRCSYFNISNGWIYYTSGKDNYNIYKIKPDGTGQRIVNKSQSPYINLIEDKLYFVKDYPNKTEVYQVGTDGSNEMPVNNP